MISKSKVSPKKYKEPKTIKERGGINQVNRVLSGAGAKHPLIVLTPSLIELNLHVKFLETLQKYNYKFSVFTHVFSNPTTKLVEEAYDLYTKDACDCIIGFGGSSAIDIAKGVGLFVANPKYREDFPKQGYLNINPKKYPYLIAIPTTAGTGSEASCTAVFTNVQDKEKFILCSPQMMPKSVIMDSSIVASLQKTTIATSGMDLLTHCIESYLSKYANSRIKNQSLNGIRAMKDVFMEFFANPNTDRLAVRMQEASFSAGLAKTSALTGYVHALSHAISAFYNAPHGYVNAVLLPAVLDAYGTSIYKKLGEINDALRIIPTNKEPKEKADAVIKWIKEFNMKLGIGVKFSGFIKNNDITPIISRAQSQIKKFGPVPKKLSKKVLEKIIKSVK